ncbi:unnamed protein product [Spirodela intermedia]|uniref:RING-type domain-containing protein n=1 Tax=Spirodela intermedia TaxID=51605 RepID=A0A7I8JYT5_SPIIN|nr:unnamed protein product [Spirodela intermedia]
MASSLVFFTFSLILLLLARPLCRGIRSFFSKETAAGSPRCPGRGHHWRREPGACLLQEKLAVLRCARAAGGAQPECAICLSTVEEGDEMRELKCRHAFHRSCMDEWLDYGRSTCPLCRVPLLAPPAADADDEALPEDVALSFSVLIHSSLFGW